MKSDRLRRGVRVLLALLFIGCAFVMMSGLRTAFNGDQSGWLTASAAFVATLAVLYGLAVTRKQDES